VLNKCPRGQRDDKLYAVGRRVMDAVSAAEHHRLRVRRAARTPTRPPRRPLADDATAGSVPLILPAGRGTRCSSRSLAGGRV